MRRETMRLRRKAIRGWYVGAILALAAVTVGSARAQTSTETQAWPSKPIRVISPIGAGSAADILSRVFSEQLSLQGGQPVVVENRPGAGGTIGANVVAKAAPDGYTVLIHSNGHTIAPAVYPNLPYNPVPDFIAVGPLAYFPNVLVVAPSKNVSSLQALVAAARAKPGSMNYASGGGGTPTHLAAGPVRFLFLPGFRRAPAHPRRQASSIGGERREARIGPSRCAHDAGSRIPQFRFQLLGRIVRARAYAGGDCRQAS